MEPTGLPTYLTHVSCAGIFAMLAFLDAFIPLPEELVLLGIGYSAAFESLNEVAVIAYVGIYRTVGYHFQRQLDRFTQALDTDRPVAVYVVLARLGIGLAVFRRRRTASAGSPP